MKIAKSQLEQIIKEEIEKLTEKGFLSNVGKYIDTGVWPGDEEPIDKHRHPKLNAIADAVRDAIGDVPRDKLKNFLWGLNSEFANTGKVTEQNNNEDI